METFKIEIELGNDAMQTSADIIGALQAWINRNDGRMVTTQAIHDANGNRVGSAWIEGDE